MKKLPSIKDDFAQWYQEVLIQAELIDQSETRGCFVIRPYGYSLWENIVKELDERIKSEGALNAYFPLLLPESFLTKEAEHVEGFAPELAVVTHGGGKKLEEPLVVRPTSETMFYSMFARWIKSWRDLPMKINQWANVVRWEMRTRPFLRTLEFLWQEGHTAHATHEEAVKTAEKMLSHYKTLYEDYLAIPVFSGIKSDSERFAGAERTYTIEGIMPDGKALQMCTSHVLSHSFPQSFGIKFQNKDGVEEVPFCTSWGFTTRAIGALVMVHGDEKGLIIPPKIAPIKAAIVPIFKTEEEKNIVFESAEKIKKLLSKSYSDVIIDTSDNKSPGAKFYHWELRGVPLRIEIGPRDAAAGNVVLVDRAEQDKEKKKKIIPMSQLEAAYTSTLTAIQHKLFKQAQEKIAQHMHKERELNTFAQKLENENGLYHVGWCKKTSCEALLKKYKGTIRCLLDKKEMIKCFACGEKSQADIFVAKAY